MATPFKYGSEIFVNTTAGMNLSLPQTTALANGSFVVTWRSDYYDGVDVGIRAQMFNTEGIAFGPEFLVNTSTFLSKANKPSQPWPMAGL